MIDTVNFPKLDAKGKVKVELFDDLTGKKIEEIKTNNFIAKGVEYYFKVLMANQFTRNKAGGHSIEHTVNNLFERMTLTDASHPEQPEKEWYIKGNEIGWALTSGTYSGSDEKRGSYNISESFTTQEQVHIVVDFPTHAANGTFQSIYFTPNSEPLNYSIFRPFVLRDLPGVLKVQRYNNQIWVLHSSSGGSSSGGSFDISISRYDLDYNLVETYTLPYHKLDFYIHNNYIYYTENTSSRGLQRAPLSNPTNLTTVINQYINGDERLSGIVFDHKNNQFVISSSSSGSSSGGSASSSISRYDASFNLLSNTPYVFPNGGYYFQKMFITDDGDIFVNGYNRSYILQNNKAEMDAKIGLVMGVIDDYKVMRNGEVMPQTGISSRALLDAPVTKTSNVTMKITYDFMLPSLI